MKYTYSLLEAAALWSGLDPLSIFERIEMADRSKLDASHAIAVARAAEMDAEEQATHLAQLNVCDFQCVQAESCPTLKRIVYDADEYTILDCPYGFRDKPSEAVLRPTIVSKPSLQPRAPYPGEFADHPLFEQRLAWLEQAIAEHDLRGSLASIRARDLREWIDANFPNERPVFLYENIVGSAVHVDPAFDDQAMGKSTDSQREEAMGLKRSEQQFQVIESVALREKLLPKNVRKGGKAAIKKVCEAEYPSLFPSGKGTFDGIWKRAIEAGRVRVSNSEGYSSKGTG
jgi:hypothetical protein